MGRSGVAGLNYCLTDNKFQQEHIELGPEKSQIIHTFLYTGVRVLRGTERDQRLM